MNPFVRHRPLGDEQPYSVSPDGRSPRRPRPGDSISINAVTYPAQAAKSVWVTVESDGGSAQRKHICEHTGTVETEVTESDGRMRARETSAWTAELGVCNASVRYSVTAMFDEGEQTSGPHTLQLSEVIELGCVERIVAWDTAMQIDYQSCGRQGVQYRQIVDLAPGDTLRISFAPSESLRAPESGLPVVLYKHEGSHQNGADRNSLDDTVGAKLGEFSVSVETKRGLLTIRDAGSSPVWGECRVPQVVLPPESELTEVTRYLTSPESEGFYGLGERYHAFNQRGTRVDTFVYDQCRRQGLRSYIPVPFVVSSRGYGLWADTARSCLFDLAASEAEVVSLRCTDHCVDLRLFTGEPRDLVQAFTGLTGRTPVPPEWVFGPWMSSNEWNSQERLEREVRTTLENDIPATVVVVEAWSDEQTFYIWNDATVEPKGAEEPIHYEDLKIDPNGKWPDPRSMINGIHDQGMRFVLWQVPAIKALVADHEQHRRDEDYVETQGLCVRESDGTPYRIRPGWFRGGLVPDFTNPETRKWWFNKRRYLVEECGVDGFKTDGGEHLWGDGTRFNNGKRGDEMINAFPVEYLQAYHSATAEWGADAITFSRSGHTGVQRFPVHWAGDQESTWDEFRAVYRAVLNAGLAGIGILGWDLAGFAGDVPTAELYKRSTSCTAFSPIMQYHSEFNDHRTPCVDRSPWNMQARTGDAGVLTVYRRYAHLRMRLIPYLRAEAANCSATGDPLMAPVFYYHPDEQPAWDIADQHFLGRSLLVAPILTEGTSRRSVFLPRGEWLDIWTGDEITGPTTIEREVTTDGIAVYLKRGAPWPYDGTEIFQDLPEIE